MKVAVYVRDVGPDSGGGYTYERDILEALAFAREAAGHLVVAAGWSPVPPDGWKADAYVSLRGNLGSRLMGKTRRGAAAVLSRDVSRDARARVDRVLAAHAIDLVWCLGAGAPTRALPYVTTIWDLQHRLQPIFPEVAAGEEWVNREMHFSREIGRAAMVVVGTSAGQAEVERFYGVPPERIRRLPHPTPRFALDPPVASDDVLTRYGLEPGYVFYPAQFWAHKNHVGLLHALRLLRDDHGVHLQAVFVGSDKGNEAHVRQVAELLGLGGQVRFLGFVQRSDLVSLYRHAFALAYMTFFGPENLPPLEAFALGCPVVASDVPGAVEQLGDAALLVPPTSPSRIAEALLALHRDGALRNRLVDRGRVRAGSYTAPHYARAMFAILDELAPIVRTWR